MRITRIVNGYESVLFLNACDPRRQATVVINNEVLEAPYIVANGKQG